MNTISKATIERLIGTSISPDRKTVLEPLIEYIQSKVAKKEKVQLVFVCTHNSRRSQFAQIWARIASVYFHIDQVECFSGGTEVTALYPMVARTLGNNGLLVSSDGEEINPKYTVRFGEGLSQVLYSKRYDDPSVPQKDFAAIMTCSHADDNCPLIEGAEKRISVTYLDPKQYDQSDDQKERYGLKSDEIGAEMLYVFGSINK